MRGRGRLERRRRQRQADSFDVLVGAGSRANDRVGGLLHEMKVSEHPHLSVCSGIIGRQEAVWKGVQASISVMDAYFPTCRLRRYKDAWVCEVLHAGVSVKAPTATALQGLPLGNCIYLD